MGIARNGRDHAMVKWFRLEDVSTFRASRVEELRPRSNPSGRQVLVWRINWISSWGKRWPKRLYLRY